MDFNKLIFMYLIVILLFINHGAWMAYSQKQILKRELRFSKFDFHFANKSQGVVLECAFKQYNNKHSLFIHAIGYEYITQFHVKFIVSKCKEYYVDCRNVMIYEVSDVCSKIHLFNSYLMISSTTFSLKKCPIHGEIYYKNLTIDEKKFESSMNFVSVRWWEYYWKIKLIIYNMEHKTYITTSVDFYIVQFRSRNRNI